MAPVSALLLVTSVAAGSCAAYHAASLVCGANAGSVRVLRDGLLAAVRRVAARAASLGFVSRARARRLEERRQEQMRGEMPEMLRLICIALESGSSLIRALEYAADTCTGPLADELGKCVWDLKAGQGFDEAMDKLRKRSKIPEFGYLAAAFAIQHQSGGSLRGVLESALESLKKVSELQESLLTQTAQGRLSARVVAAMPFAVLGLLTLMSPSYLADFFSSPLGVVMLILAALLEALGIVLVRRALAVDLSAGSLGGAR